MIGGAAAGREFAVVGLARHSRLERGLGAAVVDGSLPRLVQYAELDAALEWCENRLLSEHGAAPADGPELPLAEHELLRGLDAEDLLAVANLALRREFAPRQLLVREGELADELFLLVRGGLSVLASGPDGELRRLATLSPGMSLGESALLARGTRTAFVRADSAAVCWALPVAALENASRTRPGLMTALLTNVLRSTLQIVGRLSGELAARAS